MDRTNWNTQLNDLTDEQLKEELNYLDCLDTSQCSKTHREKIIRMRIIRSALRHRGVSISSSLDD